MENDLSEIKIKRETEAISESQLKAVFREVQDINKLLNQFARQATVMREISVNSAIASGHVGTESSALCEIAKQIGVLAQLLTESLKEAHLATGKISNSILTCIVEAAKREKMITAQKLIAHPNTPIDTLLLQVAESISIRYSHELIDAKQSLHKLGPLLARLKQVIHRTGSIVMSLRISSGIAEDEETSFFIPIADSLAQMAEDFANDAEELIRLMKQVNGALKTACECVKGGNYVA